jgi:hypothetical protein
MNRAGRSCITRFFYLYPMVFFKNFKFSLLLHLSVLIMVPSVVSCEKSESEPSYSGLEYFDLKTDKWLIYEVDSTVYDDFLGQVFHYKYQVKEVHAGYFFNTAGDSTMKIEKFYRLNESEKWKVKNVSTAAIRRGQALTTEDNITQVKLVFPLRRNRIWNGNAYNALDYQEFRITSIHEPYKNDLNNFDSTLTVLQRNFVTLIGEDYQLEVYAAGTGMIKKKYKSLEKEIDGTIVRGVDYTITLIDKGLNN